MPVRFGAIPLPVNKKFLDPSKLERAIQNFLDAGAENIRVDFQTTTKTWRGKPDFRIDEAGKGYERRIYTSNRIYKFVSGGTRVRYATMTPGFVPKTTPGVIGSNPGRGGVMYVNRRRPRPGIRARRFDEAIIRKWEKRWVQLYLRMLKSEGFH